MINGKVYKNKYWVPLSTKVQCFFTPPKRDRWASEATNLPTYLVHLVPKMNFKRLAQIKM